MNEICETAAKQFTVETLSFEQIPHQSKLFLDYQQNSPALKQFYGSILDSHAELSARVPEVLANYTVDRNLLADALAAMNQNWNAAPKTLENIEKLREDDSVAVVTGQQAGLFTGALYTVYKAVSIAKVAACLRGRGINAVPVFWIASEDHDFAEVAETFVQNRDGKTSEIKITTDAANENLPVGNIVLDESINQAVEKLFADLPATEFGADLQKIIRESYQPGRSLSDAFGQMMSALFADYGLILLDPLDERLKKLAAPIYDKAVEKSAEITAALVERNRKLSENGYHAQILVEEHSFPLFWIDDTDKRQSLKVQGSKSKVQSRAGREFELADLRKLAVENPSRLSPNATLRAVVQDFLLPTVCYFGGAAEVAYFAQTAEVYRILERPATPIFHRASVTVVEPRERRTFSKYDLNLIDFFAGREKLLPQIVEQFLNGETSQIFAETEEIINASLNRLDRSLLAVEPTLSANLAKRRRKILYHIGAMRTKFYRAEIRKHETTQNRFNNAFDALYPRDGLQERTVNVTSFLARYGANFVHWIYNEIDADAKEHQIIFL